MSNLVKIGQVISEKKTFKDFMVIYLYTAEEQGRITRFSTLIIHCKFQPLVKHILKKKKKFFWLPPHTPLHIYRDANLTLLSKGQRSTNDHHLNKLGRFWVLNAIYQDSAPKLFWFWRRFSSFYHIWTWRPSCSIAWNIWTNWQYRFDRRPNVKSGENCSSSFREEDI